MKGRKRHIVIDTQGHLLEVTVHAANIHDTVVGCEVFRRALKKYPTIKGVLADASYRKTMEAFVEQVLKKTVIISQRITSNPKKLKPMRAMNSFKTKRRFLHLNKTILVICFILINTVLSCGSCKNNKGGYVVGTKGNIAGMQVDKTELFEPERDFALRFILKDDTKNINLSNYKLRFSVVDGEVSFSFFSREDNGKKVQSKTSAASMSIRDFFKKVEFTAEEAKNGTVSIPFTIIPKLGADSTSVSMELVKKSKKGEEKSRGKVRIEWRKQPSL
ncbi:MAG: transposase [Candidatus Amoebophilus sp.]